MSDRISQLIHADPMTPEDVAAHIKVAYRMNRAGVAIRDFCPVMDQVEVVWGPGFQEWLSLDDACERVVSAVAAGEAAKLQKGGKMRLPANTKVVFEQSEVVAQAASGDLIISVGDEKIMKLHAGQAGLLVYFEPSIANEITAKSSSGFELQCLEIDPVEEEWTFEVFVAPEEA